MERQKKKDAGITLIALVISIIVMLILAGVSLNMMIGENGIVTQAQSAKLASEEAQWYEGAQMILASCYSGEEQICRLTAEEEASCAGDVAQIENLRKQKMVAHLRSAFEEISNGEAVMVNVYGEGYLIVVGKKALIVDKSYAILTSEENDYLVATGDEWLFEANGIGTAKLVAYNLDLSGIINIPTIVTNKENGTAYIVTELGNNIFSYATRVTKVDMSAATSLSKIGASAFAFCSNLEINVPIDLPSSITTIENQAFKKCTLLTGNINEIINKGYALGKGVFSNCPNLTGEMQTVFEQTFYIVNEATGEGSATKVEEGQFSGFSGLTGSLVIPKFIEEIGNNAFYGCSGITGLSFEGANNDTSFITSIGDYAFYGCSGISGAVVVPNSVTSIGSYCFAYSGLTGVSLSSALTTMGTNAFSNCTKLTGSLIIPGTLKNIPSYAFEYNKLTSITFQNAGDSEKVTIGRSAFRGNGSLTTVVLPNNLKTIGYEGFYQCGNLKTINLPNNLTTIEGWAFMSCNLSQITWGTGLVTLADGVFQGTKITTLPDTQTLESCGWCCFKWCSNLYSGGFDIVDYLEKHSIKTVGGSCFAFDSSLNGEYSQKITGQKGDISLGAGAFSSTNVTNVGIVPQSGETSVAANAYYNVSKFYSDATKTTVVTEIELPSTITSIGNNAFAGCTSITKIKINKEVTTIGEKAFSSCSRLNTVEFENGNALTIISAGAFEQSPIKDINIPDSVTSIGNYAFEYGGYLGSGTTDFKLPSSLKNIRN